MLYIRDHTSLPLPCSAVLQSPWLDMSGALTSPNHPNQVSDFMFRYDAMVPALNNALRPTELPFDTSEISALLANNLGGLPPQLVYAGTKETLRSDSTRWVERCRGSGGEVMTHDGVGQMHTYALGWPISSLSMSNECDALLLAFIFSHCK